MFYGGISVKYRTPLIVTSDYGDTINHEEYCKILDDHVFPLLRTHHLTLQADNARAHSCAITQYYLTREGIPVMWWPAQSPDLNPIENIWHVLKHRLLPYTLHNRDELIATAQKIWKEIG